MKLCSKVDHGIEGGKEGSTCARLDVYAWNLDLRLLDHSRKKKLDFVLVNDVVCAKVDARSFDEWCSALVGGHWRRDFAGCRRNWSCRTFSRLARACRAVRCCC